MNVLWSVNLLLPDIAKASGLPAHPFGGWLVGLSKSLADRDGTELAVASLYHGDKLVKKAVSGITYYLVPGEKKELNNNWGAVIEDFRPQIIHINGTEQKHNLEFLKSSGSIPSVISIQGLLSSCEKEYYAGMEFRDVFLRPSLRDLAKLDTIPMGRHRFKVSARAETEMLRAVRFAIGRTPWDLANVTALNPGIRYFHCDEMLRDSFYQRAYDIRKIRRHSLFISQGSYPIKGLHILLRAAALLRGEFPDLKIYVAGQNILGRTSWENLKRTGYGCYIDRLIRSLGLRDAVEFTGPLAEEEMAERMAGCHVFVLPSAIENSSNSLAEAMLMGIPCVAAYTGGTPRMLEYGECGLLYPFPEYPMLAMEIRRIFQSDRLAESLSQNARRTAFERHDKEKITQRMISIYQEICEEDHNGRGADRKK